MSLKCYIIDYTAFMNSALDGNEVAIAVVTGALLSWLSILAYSVPKGIYTQLKKHMTTTVTIDSGNSGFFSIMEGLKEQGIIKKSRYLVLINGMWGNGTLNTNLGVGNQLMNLFGIYTFVKVEQHKQDHKVIYILTMTTFGRNHNLTDTLIEVGTTRPNKDKVEIIDISNDNLTTYARRERLNELVLSDGISQTLELLWSFVDNEQWYIEKNIPWHLGVLLYGDSGTGKTKLIRAIMGELGYTTYLVKNVSDLRKVPKNDKAIIVLEEFDGMVGNRETNPKPKFESVRPVDGMSDYMEEANKFNITTALGELDGVQQTHGRIILASTNYIDNIDKALLRPGRFDIKIKMTYVTLAEFKSFVKLYYGKEISTENINIKPNITGSMLQLSFRGGITCDEFIDTHATRLDTL